ncbi:MAG: V-type ATP synthase subunit I [Candidatus Geothermincolia bacterium]
MAVEQVEKISIIAHRDLQDEVIDTLTRLGTVHLEQVREDDGLPCKQLSEVEAELARQYAFDISKTEFLQGFLKKNQTEKQGFLRGLIKPKYPMTYDEFMSARGRFDLDRVYRECSTMDRRYLSLTERKGRLERELAELEHWKRLEISMSELKGDRFLHIVTVRVALPDVEQVTAGLAARAPASSLDIVDENEVWAACVILHHPSIDAEVASVLSEHTTEIVHLRDLSAEPLERFEQLQREITALDRRRDEILSNTSAFTRLLPDLDVLNEFLQHQRRQLELSTLFGATRSTLVVEGWVTESSKGRTLEEIEGISPEIAISADVEANDSTPPTSLKNPKWLKPFEILVNLFGPPNRGESDPTLIVAISFMIFFGFCIGDVGYGICLAIAFPLMKRFLPLGVKAKQFLTAMTYGAVWAAIIGIFTGSWFGIETQKLPGFMRSVAVLEGLSKTVLAMAVVMLIGVIHMLIGVGIEFRDNWKDGNKSDALIDQGLVFLLFVGGGVTGALAALKVIPMTVPEVVVLAAVVGMIALLGRSAKSIAGKAVNGLYETYGVVVGFISDTISYVRLFALGLATFMIAYVINTMSGMVLGIAPVIGILLMLIILVVGHTFNIAINLLGAFVHPLRLEFVEFFGKFYEDGGRAFAPIGVDSKIVLIEEGENPRPSGKGGGN